ncbi:MAG TPA: hypothetical protein DCY12_10640 [Candidatus Atribacteria bacterium]|nr:hypothetical protein [Candidatus Atribacteria bacterium]
MNKELIKNVIAKLMGDGIELDNVEDAVNCLKQTVAPGLNIRAYSFIISSLFPEVVENLGYKVEFKPEPMIQKLSGKKVLTSELIPKDTIILGTGE